jgi:signal transduction histidine kinase
MDVGRVARLATDLASVIAAPLERAAQPSDVNELVERALSLARHRLGGDSEVMLDLGNLPLIEVDPVRVVQALAHLLIDAAAAATAVSGTVQVTTTAAAGGVRVTLGYPSAPHGVLRFGPLIERSLDAEGARITYSDDGEGTQAVLSLAPRK